METRTFSPVTRANQTKQRQHAPPPEAHPGPAFVLGVHSNTGARPTGLGCTTSLPASRVLLSGLSLSGWRGQGTRCQKRKWKAKLNLCGPFSGCWMSHYYISAWHFTASRGGGQVLKAEQTAGTQASLCPCSLPGLMNKRWRFCLCRFPGTL